MDATREGIEIQVIVVAMSVMILLSVGVIAFFIVYQRRLLAQYTKQEKMKSDYQVDLLKASITSQERERSRVSKDLHDNIGAMLTTTKIYSQQISSDLAPNELQELTTKVNQLLESTLESTRTISHNLSPIVLSKLGLLEAIRSLLKTVSDTGKINCELKTVDSVHFSSEDALNVYRIIQELITNTLKHSNSTELFLGISSLDGRIQIAYEDNGGAFDPAEINHKKGIGLKNIDSRVSVLNGEIQYHQSAKGMKVSLSIPAEFIG